jgi:fatty-acyl-CoA synthase
MGIFGAEAIDAAVLDRFEEHRQAIGLGPGVLCGAYGLAEATLVVTTSRPGVGARIDRIDLDAFADGEALPVPEDHSPVRRVVSCGPPMPGIGIRIMGPDGPLPERRIGEIQVSGPTLMKGYEAIPDDEQPFTSDGWLQTGDLGYQADGDLYVTGRVKDIIIVVGRNYAPEDFEWVAQQVAGVRPGRCVAFGQPGEGEGHAVMLFEPAPGTDPETTATEVRRKINHSMGVAMGDVVPVAKGTIAKTTSGKLQRASMRDAYARGDVARWSPSTAPPGDA